MTKTQAIVETGLTPMDFRVICERLEIDPDASDYMGIDVIKIKNHMNDIGKKTFKHSDSIEDGYTAGEAADIIGITKGTFNAEYSKQAVRLRHGIYSKESIHALKDYRDNKKKRGDRATVPVNNKSEARLQRVTIDGDGEHSTITLHIENCTKEELLNKLLLAFN